MIVLNQTNTEKIEFDFNDYKISVEGVDFSLIKEFLNEEQIECLFMNDAVILINHNSKGIECELNCEVGLIEFNGKVYLTSVFLIDENIDEISEIQKVDLTFDFRHHLKKITIEAK